MIHKSWLSNLNSIKVFSITKDILNFGPYGTVTEKKLIKLVIFKKLIECTNRFQTIANGF
jgi:hypothetical protein